MKIQWVYLLAAVVLLLPPLPFSAPFARALLKTRGGGLAQALGALRVWQNWVDLLRAAVGVYLLSNWAIIEDPLKPGGEFKALAIISAVLGIVILAQTVRTLRGVQVLGPVFYLCGLTLILGGLIQGAFAVAVGWSFAIGGKNLAYQMPAMAVALGAAGYVLGHGLTLVVNCVLIFLPFVVATLFKKRLIFAANPAPV